jgi:hypothetical protein
MNDGLSMEKMTMSRRESLQSGHPQDLASPPMCRSRYRQELFFKAYTNPGGPGQACCLHQSKVGTEFYELEHFKARTGKMTFLVVV